MESTALLSRELVGAFVQAAHFDLAKVRELHQQHPDLLNARWDKFNETALEAAAHVGQRAIAEYLLALLAAGAPLTICAAAMLGQTEAVAAFLQADPSQVHAVGAHGITLLYHAALSGNTAIADVLWSYGGGAGASAALHAAARFGHTAMAGWLLDHGASEVNILNFEQKTPLQVASERGYSEVVALLRRYGGVDIPNG